ncbi:MAG: thymidine phosphorylase [Pyrinomonadaceae bacterium]
MKPQSIIEKKRDGKRLTKDEINAFIEGVTDDSWADYQITALIMAMFLNELNEEEQAWITDAMLHSGDVLDFSEIDRHKSDKHSTGGVGDKTSLAIAPLAACCGLAVPMISGRGLGHTGGTLDKLEAISGYNVRLTTTQIHEVIAKCGYAMAGQTKEIAPADRKIYALRDATATVPTIPLIVASIMSKKLAEGLDSLVLDVKTGNGAFMERLEDSRRLARAMVETGLRCGVKTKAFVTDMGEPLGEYVGNAVEVFEILKILRNESGERSSRLLELTLELTAAMLVAGEITETKQAALDILEQKLASGEALEKFRENLILQGGDPSICDAPAILFPDGLISGEVVAPDDGYVQDIDTKAIGLAVCDIGGGRIKAEDVVDPFVGLRVLAGKGCAVSKGEPIGMLYVRSANDLETASKAILGAYRFSSERHEIEPVIVEEVG